MSCVACVHPHVHSHLSMSVQPRLTELFTQHQQKLACEHVHHSVSSVQRTKRKTHHTVKTKSIAGGVWCEARSPPAQHEHPADNLVSNLVIATALQHRGTVSTDPPTQKANRQLVPHHWMPISRAVDRRNTTRARKGRHVHGAHVVDAWGGFVCGT